MECDRDIKKLYPVIYNMAGKCSVNPLPDSNSDKELANNFADFFINTIKVIRDQLNEYPKYDLSLNSKPIPTMLNKFEPMTAEDITLIIKSVVSKSCELDVVPTTLLKDILLNNRYPSQNYQCLPGTGCFCRQMESGHSKTTTEETGLELILNNYRPVPNFSFL